MQDFTKMVTTREIKPLSQVSPKKGPEKWLNKDRIWNLVFWFGMSSGLGVAHFVRTNLHMPGIAKFIYVSTFVGIPLLLIIFNRTCFIKKDTFANSEGKELTIKQMPYSFPLTIMAGLGISVLVSHTILPKDTNSLFVAITLSCSIFSGISLYFILKNCPIAILLNYKFWTFNAYLGREGAGSSFSSSSNNAHYDRMRNSSNYMNKITNPGYSYRPENIWHNSRVNHLVCVSFKFYFPINYI